MSEEQKEQKDSLKLLPANAGENIEPVKESFLRRALNRTKEAIRNVDEAITGREAARRIEERFHQQSDLNDSLTDQLEQTHEDMAELRQRLDDEIVKLLEAAAAQNSTFERTAAEISATAQELRQTAESAAQSLAKAHEQHTELEQQASGQLARWRNESESLKQDVRALQNHLTALQHAQKNFLFTTIAFFIMFAALILYLFLRH